MEFYVYALIDPRDNQYFYIGKGKGNRYMSHLKDLNDNLNKLKNKRIRAIQRAGKKVEISILFTNLNEETSLELEKIIIYKLGRAILFEGVLTNLVPGGAWNHNESLFYPKDFNTSFDLSTLQTVEQNKFLQIPNISKFNYLNSKENKQIIYKYNSSGLMLQALTLDVFFRGGITKERILILTALRENDLPIYYGCIYSKYPLINLYFSDKIPYSLCDIIDTHFNKRFDYLYSRVNQFDLVSTVKGKTAAKIEKKGDIISFTSYYKSGKQKYHHQTKHGYSFGVNTKWYSNGRIDIQKKYSANKKLYYKKAYYKNGSIKEVFEIIDETKTHKRWYANGRLSMQYILDKGYVYYNENGLLTSADWLDSEGLSQQTKLDFDF